VKHKGAVMDKEELDIAIKRGDKFKELTEYYHKEVERLRFELAELVKEIEAIKHERNYIIKSHADLLSENMELKSQLKYQEIRNAIHD
jgi:regulator of replication initiation timing